MVQNRVSRPFRLQPMTFVRGNTLSGFAHAGPFIAGWPPARLAACCPDSYFGGRNCSLGPTLSRRYNLSP